MPANLYELLVSKLKQVYQLCKNIVKLLIFGAIFVEGELKYVYNKITRNELCATVNEYEIPNF